MGKTGHAVLVAALFVAAVAVVPGGAVAADGLAVTGEQADDGTVTVTVTENSTAVANASVTVEALNNSTYAGAGSYETGENGTVDLAAPEQNVTVDVTAEANNTTATTTLDLVASTDDTSDELAVGVTQADDGSAAVSVTTNGTGVPNASVAVAAQDNVSYAGEGNYAADENGTVGLPAPEQNVTVDVTADADNQTATTTATLTVSENATDEDAFGARVSAFVRALQLDGNMSGQAVAEFVTANNPGADNRSDTANQGPPEDAGNDESEDDADADDEPEDDESDADGESNDDNGNGNDSDDEKGNSDTGNNGNGNGGGNGNGNGNGPP
ncbi:hypothetical protein [Halobacterium jilantaiense]|uniref:Uncharacterized protein n=1 Tax=Halobacterium jilantaiense TaxID=355548 RepID=A0A1I0PVW8_9EURY|nr:hypothetical protein [Halobacterium jilantaiense]SEW18413.1 hypothetical protein SAMN04487945_1998 [Halobacterium jilantaiense]